MAVNWEITSQRQTDELMGNGSFEGHMEVNFTVIPEGTNGQIKVPLRLYAADYVRDQIDAYVDRIKAVHNL